jgi:fumarylacetoacetate (FAA) hydrolase family protein
MAEGPVVPGPAHGGPGLDPGDAPLLADPLAILPADGPAGTLVGRVWLPEVEAPTVVVVAEEGVLDASPVATTVSDLLELPDPVGALRRELGRLEPVGSLSALAAASLVPARRAAERVFLAPVDLQAIKACGVTFAASLMERVVEEVARGDPARAEEVRAALGREIGAHLEGIRPGSEEARALKEALVRRDLWSPYLEVGLGPDAEVMTKAQPMSAVGVGAEVGIHPGSTWNNSEPEVVLVANSRGEVAGATLGNDVNLRDVEGRSALLLARAKDQNASCAIGPFLRLFDRTFSLDDVRSEDLHLEVTGTDGFTLHAAGTMRDISRDPADLVAQTINRHHGYPDGVALFLGTMIAPTQDRSEPGAGFTHRPGDVVAIRSPHLGTLVNRVTATDLAPPWTYGVRALARGLRRRGLDL